MRYLMSILMLLMLSNTFAQIPAGDGAIKFGFSQNGEYIFLEDSISVKYINQDNEVVLDTIYFNPENAIPAKILPAGIYKIEINVTKFPKIEVTDIIVQNGKISFLERFNIDSLINRKETFKFKYQKPLTGYKSCG
jgi:hypothetical protein